VGSIPVEIDRETVDMKKAPGIVIQQLATRVRTCKERFTAEQGAQQNNEARDAGPSQDFLTRGLDAALDPLTVTDWRFYDMPDTWFGCEFLFQVRSSGLNLIGTKKDPRLNRMLGVGVSGLVHVPGENGERAIVNVRGEKTAMTLYRLIQCDILTAVVDAETGKKLTLDGIKEGYSNDSKETFRRNSRLYTNRAALFGAGAAAAAAAVGVSALRNFVVALF
jgi:hypothetical protein